jgi:hypothetical protein
MPAGSLPRPSHKTSREAAARRRQVWPSKFRNISTAGLLSLRKWVLQPRDLTRAVRPQLSLGEGGRGDLAPSLTVKSFSTARIIKA